MTNIEELTVGTIFWGHHLDPEEPFQWWIVGENFVAGTHCGEAHPGDIDPESITRVTLPPKTMEGITDAVDS